METFLVTYSKNLRMFSYHRGGLNSFFKNWPRFVSSASIFFVVGLFFLVPVHSADWVEVEVGSDSGDTYLWPYFHSASRFIDIDSILENDTFIIYRELINAKKAISSNVSSLIVKKKSWCDGKKVLWQSFVIYKSTMGQGKPIMKLNPNETQYLKRGNSGFISDAFVCKLKGFQHRAN